MDFRWNDWNIDHIAKYGVSPEEAETVIRTARRPFPRKIEDDKWLVWGQRRAGRFLQVIFVLDPDEAVFVIHARPLTDREKRHFRRRKKAMKRTAYWNMNAEQLTDATNRFDESLIADQSRPLTAAERAQWDRVRRKRGRPKVGKGFQRVSVSLERGLLERVTALAKKRRISRSKLLAEALEEALGRS
jgi:uncharacterized protein